MILIKNNKPEARGRNIFLILLLVFSFYLSAGFSFFENIPPSKSKIVITKDKNADFRLLVNGEPFIIKGICYHPVPIGKDHSYDFWQQDLEVFRKDGELMREMGVNVIRIYQTGSDIERTKEIINYFYDEFGIRTIIGHWLGFWQGIYPDYANPKFRKEVKRDCLRMVKEFKDSEAILLWVLGNENNFSFGKQRLREWTSPKLERIEDPYKKRQAKAKIYYRFVNEVAASIKKIDKNRPVALGNGGLDFIEIAGRYCRHLELLGCSVYNGKSFGSTFRKVKWLWQKPFFISEFGCDSFNAYLNQADEEIQAQFISAQWKEIKMNMAGGSGEGNCLGGLVFEWTDEWWKADEYNLLNWSIQDEKATWSNGAYYFDITAKDNLNMNEEWWGIIKISPTSSVSANKDVRIPKKAYYALKKLWFRPQ